jgi:hypothetical protein
VGARFCRECGLSVGGAPAIAAASAARPNLPWIIAIVSVAALAVLLLVQVLGNSGGGNGSSAPPGAMSAPDISNMPPRERASRLYDRIMRLHEEQKADSVAFFAPMALTSYEDIPDLDDDGRYDLARIAMVAGQVPIARAQADTILRRNATHLLGLLLSADLARAAKDETKAASIERTFLGAVEKERAKKLPEYEAHAGEIESAMERLKKGK